MSNNPDKNTQISPEMDPGDAMPGVGGGEDAGRDASDAPEHMPTALAKAESAAA
jgi:hypothetical protein